MLIVAGTFDLLPERRDEFLAARVEAIIRSRTEAGCLEYAMSRDSLDEGRVRLFEIWENAVHLDEHLRQSRSAGSQGPGVPLLSRNVMRYEIASYGPNTLPGDAG